MGFARSEHGAALGWEHRGRACLGHRIYPRLERSYALVWRIMRSLWKGVCLVIAHARLKSHFRLQRAPRTLLTGLAVLLAFAVAALARERGPRVEVTCASSPIPVRMDRQQALIYELHVTNFDAVPLTLKRLEVFAGEGSTGPLASLDESALAAAMIRVGSAMMPSG